MIKQFEDLKKGDLLTHKTNKLFRVVRQIIGEIAFTTDACYSVENAKSTKTIQVVCKDWVIEHYNLPEKPFEPFVPKHGEQYYYIWSRGVELCTYQHGTTDHVGRVAIGNAFKTHAEASKIFDRFCEILKEGGGDKCTV